MSLGKRLKDARERMGFSQEYVGNRVDLHRTTIGKYEKDECDPPTDVLRKLIEIYCEDANYILYGKTRKVINVNNIPDFLIDKIYLMISEYNLNKKDKF